jgi:hypothetical protein
MGGCGISQFAAALRRLEGTTRLIVELVEGNDIKSRERKCLVWSVNAARDPIIPTPITRGIHGPRLRAGCHILFFATKFRSPKCAQLTLRL